MGVGLAVLRTVVIASDAPTLHYCVAAHNARLIDVPRDALASTLVGELSRGAVVVIVNTDREASQSLGLGADEVLRGGELTDESIRIAFERARTRASGRFKRDDSIDVDEIADDELAFAAIIGVLAERLGAPVQQASFDIDAVAHSLRSVLEVSDDFAKWASLQAPIEELRGLTAKRLAAPSTSELNARLTRAQAALRDASALTERVRELGRRSAAPQSGPVSVVIADVLDLIRPELERHGIRLAVHADADAACALPRTTLVIVLLSLALRAVDAIRDTGLTHGRLEFRAGEREGAFVIEVEDNGVGLPPDLRPTFAEPAANTQRRSHRLLSVRDRVRRFRGDLIVDSDATGTCVLVFLPMVQSDAPSAPRATVLQLPHPSKPRS